MQPVKPAEPPATLASRDTNQHPQIAGYRILRRLGQGGMATVYLATQESLDRPVSIKVIAHEALLDELSKQRFENEARTIAKLSHPGIVGIHDVGRTTDGRLYYCMPYLANGDLAQRDLRDDAQIVDVLRALLSALDYAHARGFVHRDVKSENVLFDADNRPLLTDFGIAMSKSDSVRITTAGMAVGSSACMAPEQARGDVVDRRADLYSVGVLAYELLAGKLPFRSSDALAMALMHAQDPIPRLPAAKIHWQSFIERAMAKSPERRFDNAQQMLAALERIGRRSGHITSIALRTYDRTLAGGSWKRPRVLAIGGALLLAGVLYAMRGALLHGGASMTSAQQVVATSIPATPTNSVNNKMIAAPAAIETPPIAAPIASAASSSSTPTDTGSQASIPTKTRAKTTHRKSVRRPVKKRSWLYRWWHR